MNMDKTTIKIVRGSVLDQEVDAIVNAANTAMRGGGGVDGAIHRAAGRGLMEELMRVAPNGAKAGSAVLTGGHDLKQPYILHTPGPVWNGGGSKEAERLASSYQSCLEKADEKGLKSIAFCSISTGVYGYPLAKAAPVALMTTRDYLETHPATSLTRVVFALFQAQEHEAFSQAWQAIAGGRGRMSIPDR